MLDISQFRRAIIRPALETIELYSLAAEELMLGTALQESGLRYLEQLGGGPALGLWQMEPETHDDIHDNYLVYRPELLQRLMLLTNLAIPLALTAQLWYAAAMCRIHYYRSPDPLPAAGDLPAQAAYWKRIYNTEQGRGTKAEYVANWRKYMDMEAR